jgi:hypothetical protein
MSNCMICLEGSYGCQLRRICGHPSCTMRIHTCCYGKWYFASSFNNRCPCGRGINTYRFGLPPLPEPENLTLTPVQPDTRLSLGEVVVTTSNRWRCSKWLPCDSNCLTSVEVFCVWWIYGSLMFIGLGYVGKLVLYRKLPGDIGIFWTMSGFTNHFIGFLISTMILMFLRVFYSARQEYQDSQLQIAATPSPASGSTETTQITCCQINI